MYEQDHTTTDLAHDMVHTLIMKIKELKKQENYKEIISCYDKILQIAPNHIEVLNEKGVLLAGLEKYDEAIACFDKILKLESDNPIAKRNKRAVVRKMVLRSEHPGFHFV